MKNLGTLKIRNNGFVIIYRKIDLGKYILYNPISFYKEK
jgi:hypothetical protein